MLKNTNILCDFIHIQTKLIGVLKKNNHISKFLNFFSILIFLNFKFIVFNLKKNLFFFKFFYFRQLIPVRKKKNLKRE